MVILPWDCKCNMFIRQYVYDCLMENGKDIYAWKLKLYYEPIGSQSNFELDDKWRFEWHGRTIIFEFKFNSYSMCECKPSIVISCIQDLKLIRQIEMHCANSHHITKVIWIKTPDLLEDFLFNELHNSENRAFSTLETLSATQLIQPVAEQNSPLIMVDWRDFKSSLPIELSRAGFRVICEYLKIGDYLLTPQLCVERKRVGTSDFKMSLLNGRLESQVKRMVSFYSQPVLLIECDVWMSERRILERHLAGLMATLLKQYPNLRVVWSCSAEQSAELLWRMRSTKLYSAVQLKNSSKFYS